MNENYDFKTVESKWQKFWIENNSFAASEDFNKPKFFALIEFPYPSGEGLHVGHPRSYVALDIISRKRRMQGYNVLYPIGWDAFGLPAENYAIKNKIHPKEITFKNIKNFKKQLQSLGLSFDWKREINTTDPKYYKWTQWIFVQLFKKGLAVKRNTCVNWCTSCKCTLANEEVIEGCCERCNSVVVQKNKAQWILKITEYAQRLIDDLDLVEYPERVKIQQKNWIGRSEGVSVKFKLKIDELAADDFLEIFTTRADTIFGVTYMVIAPEHNIIEKYYDKISNIKKINEYKEETAKKNDFTRINIISKTGVEIEGIHAINPISHEVIPIFISDYVLSNYGTGAIMAVPAHDMRDWEFAKKYNIPIKKVVSSENNSEDFFTEDGVLVNSDFLNGLSSNIARKKVVEKLKSLDQGDYKISYKLRDWIFSRQRYWGEPIPIIECSECGFVIDENLPVVLPEVEEFKPLENGESILENSPWRNVNCPKCGNKAKRETDTMPQWAGSSWYFLRYLDPFNENAIASKENLNYWMPVDWYNGGMEHTTLHLLYSRFWHKFLYDIGIVSTPEPYAKRTSHGMILGENNEKMSKSKGNVINPDEIVQEYGADTMRLYEMFMGDFEQSASWNTSSIKGCHRFLEKIWDLRKVVIDGNQIRHNLVNIFHKTIKKVTEDIENLKFNTAIASLMTLLNMIRNEKSINIAELNIFTTLLFPFAPHISEEIRTSLNLDLAQNEKWPKFEEKFIIDSQVEIVIQVNGKLKNKIIVERSTSDEEIIKLSKEKIEKNIDILKIKKNIYISKKLVNFII